MRDRLAVAVVLALALLGWGPVASAKRAPAPTKYHFELTAVTATSKAPAEVSVKAKALFAEIVAARPESVVTLEGAPDPKAQPTEFRRWLDDRGIKAFAVELKIDDYQRALLPDDKPGHTGQLLTVKIGLSLVGSQMPGNALALAGSGASTVTAGVGSTLRPREEEGALDDALRDALTHAVEDAVTKLSAPPRTAPTPPTSTTKTKKK